MLRTRQNLSRIFSKFVPATISRAGLACIGLCVLLAGCAGAQKPPDDLLSEQAQSQRKAFGGFKKRSERVREQQAATIAQITKPQAGEATTTREVDTDWAIVLYMFRGPQALEGGTRGLYKVQNELGLADAYLGERSGGVAILYGRYKGPGDKQAQTDLATIKAIKLEGEPLFVEAVLAPPQASADEGALPDFDLAQVKAKQPEVVYALQVGIYRHIDGSDASPQELADFRDAAEKAVLALRAQGQEAYYYHGPRSSTVTVGLFTEDDYITSVRDELGQFQKLPRPKFSDRVRAAMETNPHNLVNGQGIRDGKRDRLQPSFLIRVPG